MKFDNFIRQQRKERKMLRKERGADFEVQVHPIEPSPSSHPPASIDSSSKLGKQATDYIGKSLSIGGKESSPVNLSSPTSLLACNACGKGDYWESVSGVMICAICHPPASGRLIRRRIKLNLN